MPTHRKAALGPWLLLLCLLAALVACGPVPATRSATAEAAPAPEEEAFQNPLFRQDFADPGVLQVSDGYYAYATNASGRNVQLAHSADLVNWELLRRDALPALPSWAQLGGSYVWAPEVIQIDEQYVLYFTARDKEADLQCVGVATSAEPQGPFQSTADEPLVCQVDEGGSIDASPFRDEDGTLYLYWKNDGNCCNMTTYLYGQQMAPDGLSLLGEPVRLVQNDAFWEGSLVEAPTMWRQDDRYYLFFSANNYGGFEYAVGYATCDSPLGPCEDSPDNPILAGVKATAQSPAVIGPGHQTIVQDDEGDLWMVYHVWELTGGGSRGSRRFMWMDPLVWENGKPDVLGPSIEPQPLP